MMVTRPSPRAVDACARIGGNSNQETESEKTMKTAHTEPTAKQISKQTTSCETLSRREILAGLGAVGATMLLPGGLTRLRLRPTSHALVGLRAPSTDRNTNMCK